VETPNVVVVLDHTLLKYDEVTSGLVKGGWLIVNSWQHPKEFDLGGDFNIATADATEVCSSLGLIVAGLTVVNTAMLGAFIRATQAVGMASIEKAVRERFSDREVNTNLTAIAETYKITKLQRLK
jgi:2-oxoacid:acceptor oxidoreductase gamma subunit (pyruvate/2-ketoisovalerate family)